MKNCNNCSCYNPLDNYCSIRNIKTPPTIFCGKWGSPNFLGMNTQPSAPPEWVVMFEQMGEKKKVRVKGWPSIDVIKKEYINLLPTGSKIIWVYPV